MILLGNLELKVEKNFSKKKKYNKLFLVFFEKETKRLNEFVFGKENFGKKKKATK